MLLFKSIWKKKALILFIAVLVLLLPQAVSRPAQVFSKALLTEITIDKLEDNYSLAGKAVILPDDEKPKEISAVGKSLGEAINKMAEDTNREISFAHCTLIIIGEGLAEENLTDTLRYFLYKTELNNNCTLAYKEKGYDTTLEKFYKDYMRRYSTCLLAEGTAKYAVFKQGNYAFSTDETQKQALDFALGKSSDNRIVQDGNILKVLSGKASLKTRNNTADVEITLKLELENSPHASNAEIKQIKTKLKEEITRQVGDMLDFCYGRNADVLQLFKIPQDFNIKVDAKIITL
jgi:hypothetical protein